MLPVALVLVGCGGVPPELLGAWKGTSTMTVEGQSTMLNSQALVTDAGGKLEITASGNSVDSATSPTITCRAQGNVTSTGFEIVAGGCDIEGYPVWCDGVEKVMTVDITRLTAVRSDRQLNVNTSGKVSHPCPGGGRPTIDFSMVSTLTKQ